MCPPGLRPSAIRRACGCDGVQGPQQLVAEPLPVAPAMDQVVAPEIIAGCSRELFRPRPGGEPHRRRKCPERLDHGAVANALEQIPRIARHQRGPARAPFAADEEAVPYGIEPAGL